MSLQDRLCAEGVPPLMLRIVLPLPLQCGGLLLLPTVVHYTV